MVSDKPHVSDRTCEADRFREFVVSLTGTPENRHANAGTCERAHASGRHALQAGDTGKVNEGRGDTDRNPVWSADHGS
jgi:hypothetical protein